MREALKRRYDKTKVLTSNFTATSAWSDGFFTNRGASGTVTLTLPAVAANKGFRCQLLRVTAQTFRVRPAAGEQIMTVDGSLFTAAKGAELATDGALVVVESDGTNWCLTYARGTVNQEA